MKPIKIVIQDKSINIENSTTDISEKIEAYAQIKLDAESTFLDVFENGNKIITYLIEQMTNEKIVGKYANLHTMLFPDKRLFTEVVIVDNPTQKFALNTTDNLVYRMQPVYLNAAKVKNSESFGFGPVDRRLVRPDYTTPTNYILVMVCDNCQKPFTVQHLHMGINEAQYFYSKDGLKAAAIDYSILNKKYPTITTHNPAKQELDLLEKRLHELDPQNDFAYYNSFKCKYCGHSQIDFQKFPEMRNTEFHVYLHKGEKIIKFAQEVLN